MIYNQFPPFENEHLYSWLVRLYCLSGYPSFLAFQASLGINTRFLKPQQIFGSCTSGCLSLFNDDPVERLFNHMPLSLWQIAVPNLTTREFSLIKNQFETLKHMNEQQMFNFETSWMSCPKCRQEDVKRYGATYWHMDHQLPSIFMCSKHESVLEYALPQVRNIYVGLLPQDIDSWRPCLKSISEPLLKWQAFYLNLYTNCNISADYASRIRGKLVNKFNLKGKTVSEQRRVLQELTPDFEESLGHTLLSYLFRDYARDSGRGKIHILSNVFVNQYKPTGIRNPIYWIAIAYWLRDELSILK